MRNHFNLFDFWRASVAAATIAAEANLVIAMRLAGFAGFWNIPRAEAQAMVAEKATAVHAAGRAALSAAMRGESASGVAIAAMKPVQRKTGANMRRLAKRGPGRPG